MFARLASLFRLRTRVSLTFLNSLIRKFLPRLFCISHAGFFPIPTREMIRVSLTNSRLLGILEDAIKELSSVLTIL
jgi:hypothetical protein